MEQTVHAIAGKDVPAHDDSIPELLSRVVADAQTFARAEIDLQKARVSAKVREARSGVLLALAAFTLASLALVGLVVGMLLVLTHSVGAIWATIIVVGTLLAGAALLGWLAIRQVKLLFGAAKDMP